MQRVAHENGNPDMMADAILPELPAKLVARQLRLPGF
jgi:hypothetical protein